MASKLKQAQDRIAQLEHANSIIEKRIEFFREQLELENLERRNKINSNRESIARLKSQHGIA